MDGKKRKTNNNAKGLDYWKKWCERGQDSSTVEPRTSNHTTDVTNAFSNVTPSQGSAPKLSLATEQSSTTSLMLPIVDKPVVFSAINHAELDVGFYCDEELKINDYLKSQILKNPWVPSNDYQFPTSTIRNLRFQLKWLERFPWLSYSEHKCGAFCRVCVIMGRGAEGKGSHQRVGQLVCEPFVKWKKALEIFQTHAQSAYHKRNSEQADNFLKVMSSEATSIIDHLCSENQRQKEENQKKLTSIVKAIIFCGKQGISLRGKKDSGRILTSSQPEEAFKNDGNFRALLRYGAESGDKHLSEHLATASHNALYTSPQIQNELIGICGAIIQNNIISEVKKARLFSILADETTDIGRVEQVSLCLRYVDAEDDKYHKVKEMFLGYIPTVDVTGLGLSNLIINALKSHGLECCHVVGQGYDGAASMSGHLQGAQAYVRRECPLALYVHCSAHSLNLAIADSCSRAEIRNCVGIVQSVGTYFRNSAQRSAILKNKIVEILPTEHQKNLLTMCETRWVHKHEAIIRFKEIYSAILAALEELQSVHNKETSQKAVQLLYTLRSSKFVICLLIMEKLMSYTLPLSKLLQTVNTDLITAFSHVDTVVNTLQLVRQKADDEFSNIFEEAKNILTESDGTLEMPRIVARQLNRSNTSAADISTYYKINLFIPFLDHTVQQLTERFAKHRKLVLALSGLLPKYFSGGPAIDEAVVMYSSVLQESNANVIKAELEVWKSAITSNSFTPQTVLECLDHCNKNLYPNINTLLQILATIPVSTATPERTFSTLRRLKDYLRNSTTENRLNGLALMNIHYEIYIDAKEVVNRFSKINNRRILL